MVALPRYQAQVAAPDARLDPALFTAAGQGQARAGLLVADLSSEASARYQQAREAQTLIREQAAVTRELNDLRSSFDGDTDWGTMTPRFEQRAAEIMQRRRQTLKDDPNVLAMLERDFTRDFERERVGVQRLARTRQTASGKADLETALQVHAENAAREADPAMRVEIEGRARAAIQGMVAAGFLAEDDGVKRETQFMDRVREARVLNLVRTDPEGAVRRLMDTSDQDFAGMDPAARERALRNAQGEVDRRLREDNARYDREQREADKRLQRDGEQQVKDAYAALDREGTLAPAALDRLRRHGGVSASEYRVLQKASRGETADADDRQTVIDLTRDLHRLEPDDFERAASKALMGDKLKIETYRSLVGRNRELTRDDRPSSPFRSGRELVTTTLDPGQIFQGPAAAIGRSAQAQAAAEFDNWAETNPKATRAEAMSQAQDIITRYQVIRFDQLEMGLGVPMFHRAARSTLDLAALDRAEAATIQALDAKRITQAQADQEARKIEGWRAVLAQKAAAKPKPGNNR